MRKYNKIRGILRARQGSQIPKYYNGGNPYMIADPRPSMLQDATSSFNPSMLNSDLYNTPGNIPTFKPSFWQKAKIVGKGLGKKTIDFASENQGLVTSGINTAMNSIDNTKNSSTFNMASGALLTASKIPGWIGWAATGTNTLLRGVNKLTSKTIDTHTMSEQEKSKAGNYGGMIALNNKVSALEGVEFGGIGGGSEYREGKRNNNELLRLLNIWRGISNTADNQFAMAGNDIYLLGYEMLQNGGYPTQFLRASKQGGTLTQKIDIVKSRKFNQVINVDTKLVEEFKEGGKLEVSEWEPVIELFEEWEPEIELEMFQEGGILKQSFEEWFNSIPKDNRASGYDYKKAYEVLDWETLYNHTKDPEKYHLYSVSPIADENGNYPFLKLGTIEENPELKGEFDWYNSEEGKEHKSKFDVLFINDRYYYVPKKFKDGGKAKEELETPEIEETNQKNLIPEGALHKNKHHMEHTEGLTQKGIPVIDNDGEQLAEIELDEIIFTLEVTKKLEELYKEGTDEAAIEAGKLLVKEILFNTDDRTSLIEKILI